ncbi:MAG: hypothetical protein L6Q84_25745 [Polyangiaceae bacterium]|nr:hypothetical protein [Polyangiaceae bacterium]
MRPVRPPWYLSVVACLLAGCGEEFEPANSGPDGASCNGPGALSDDFEDGELNDAFRSSAFGTDMVIEEADGTLVFSPTDSGGSGSFESRYAINLRGSSVVVEVPNPGASFKGRSISLSLVEGTTASILMAASDDLQSPGTSKLRFEVTTEEGSTKDSAPFDPVAQRWWRLGEKDGVLSFAASPDGAAWTTLGEVPAPAFVDASNLRLGMSDSAKVVPVGAVRFDNLNPQGGSFCGIDRLRETFDQEPGQSWAKVESGKCAITVAGGALAATLPPSSGGECSLKSRHGYDLRGRAITFAFGGLPAEAPGTSVSVSLTSGDSDHLTLEHRQGKLTATSLLGSATSTGALALGSGPAWWRIRESAGRVEFELSSDGESFQSVHSLLVDALPARFAVSLRFYVNFAVPETKSVIVDGIN